jgi:hypothetical protein
MPTYLVNGTTPLPENGETTTWGTTLNAAIQNIDSRFTYSSPNYGLASTVLSSSLTSVGTLSSLTVSGNTTISGNFTVTGNVTINGTTTTINSTTLTTDDILLTLGGDTAPTADSNTDRGIEFRYFSGTAKLGFFGYDDSTGKLTFIPDATNTASVFSGTLGTIDVGAVHINGSQIAASNLSNGTTGTGLVVLATSPTFSGTPTLPTGTIATTQTAGNNTTAVATTAFVTTADNLKANIASPTFTGQVTVPAGSSSAAPIIFQNGALLTAAAGGRMEYDGNVFYLTPSTTAVGGRGVAQASHYYALSSARTLTDVNTVQSIFGVSLTVQATTTYEFEMQLSVSTTGATSNSLGIGFGGSATLTSIAYHVDAAQNATSAATLSSGSNAFVATASNTAITAAVATATYRVVKVRGVVRINASGTFTPQLTYSAAPGAAPSVAANSFIKMTPVGTNTVTTVGAWA